MGSMRTFLATMLLGSALLALQTDAYSQSRRGERSSSGSSRSSSVQKSTSSSSSRKSPDVSQGSTASSSSRQVARPSYNTGSKQPASRPSGSVTRPSGQTSRPSGSVTRPSGQTNRPSGSVTRPSGQTNRPSGSVTRPSGQTSRPSGSVTRPSKPSKGVVTRPPRHPNRPVVTHKPPHSTVRPPMRPPIYVYPKYVYKPYCGKRPPRPRPGVIYRPYYGTVIAHNIVAGMAWTTVRMAYFATAVRVYSQINENNAYIAEQNAIIAQNNSTIAAQNHAIAHADALAQAAYTKAVNLGLVQSYAAADMEYFYQNGVFYVLDVDGDYKVIIPPAGALVDSLPSDRKTVNIGGEIYYQVDDTIYEARNIDGQLYFEVLGQRYN